MVDALEIGGVGGGVLDPAIALLFRALDWRVMWATSANKSEPAEEARRPNPGRWVVGGGFCCWDGGCLERSPLDLLDETRSKPGSLSPSISLSVSACGPGPLTLTEPVPLPVLALVMVWFDCVRLNEDEFDLSDAREVADDLEENDGEPGSTAPPHTNPASPRLCRPCPDSEDHPR